MDAAFCVVVAVFVCDDISLRRIIHAIRFNELKALSFKVLSLRILSFLDHLLSLVLYYSCVFEGSKKKASQKYVTRRIYRRYNTREEIHVQPLRFDGKGVISKRI